MLILPLRILMYYGMLFSRVRALRRRDVCPRLEDLEPLDIEPNSNHQELRECLTREFRLAYPTCPACVIVRKDYADSSQCECFQCVSRALTGHCLDEFRSITNLTDTSAVHLPLLNSSGMDTILLNAQQIDEHHIFYLMDENLVLRRNLMGFEVEILIDQFLAHLFRIRQASNYQQDMVDAEAASFQSAMDIRIQALCGVHGGDSVALWNLSKNGSETEDFELLQDSENFSEKLQTGIKSRRATWARYFMKRTFLESPKTQPEMASLHLKIRDLSHQSRTQKSKLEAPGSKNQSRYISSVLRTLKKKSILIAFVSFAITAALVTKFSPFSGLLYRLFVSANIYPDLSDGGPFQDNILLEDEDFESCTLYNLSSEIPHGNLSFKEMTAFVTTHCRAFYDAITQFSSTIRLQVVPDDFRDTSCANSNFLFVNSCNEIEIICFKTTFLKLFNEAHLYFNAFKSERNYPLNQESYLASVALLFTSPENRSALNCHDIIISKVLETEREAYTDYWSIPSIFLQKEFLFLRALLTCSLNRINKSSSLWLLLRKIYVIYKERFSILNLDFQSVFQRSAEQHFSNYYCWNTVRWFYDVEGIESKLALLNQTKEFSFKHIKDVSAWSALAYMACRTHSREEFHDSEYRRLGSHFQVEIQRNGFKNDTSLLPKRLSLIEEIKTYIELAEVREWPPYFCLWCLMSLEGKNKVLDIFEDWYNQLLDFERIYGRVTAIESVGNQPQVQDTISHTLIEVMSNKKKLLQKLNINF